MKALIDACVLYPTILREIMLGVAKAGIYEPLWSARILEEWARAAAKLGPEGEMIARGEIANLKAAWPASEIAIGEDADPRFWLPDPNDIHVLAAAVEGQADQIVTLNLKDFPRRELDGFGLSAVHPDVFLTGAYNDGAAIGPVVQTVLDQAEALSSDPIDRGKILKRARLPRLRKAFLRGGDLSDQS